MTKQQAVEAGRALVAWSEGREVKVRPASGEDRSWHTFSPHSYETLKVEAGLEWAIEDRASTSREQLRADDGRRPPLQTELIPR